MMGRFAWGLLVLGLLGLPAGACAPAAAAPERVEVDAPADVRGLRLADVDGDGIKDLLLIGGREVRIYRGRRGQLPLGAPTWTVKAPDDVSFVDVAAPDTQGRPALLTFGERGASRLPLADKAQPEAVAGGAALSWRDSSKITFSTLSQPGGALLLPGRDRWTYLPRGKAPPVLLPVAPFRVVLAAGPFLEDTSEAIWGLPDVFLGRPASSDAASDSACLWCIDGQQLVAQTATKRVSYDLTFLHRNAGTGQVEQHLVDLDGDGRPELVHRLHTNQETRYGFFRTRPAAADSATGPTHKPATSAIYLTGYQFEPDLVDLNADGYPDLVVTNIALTPANTFLALATGKVTAETLAFLNRGPDGAGYFRDAPDIAVKSRIGVNVGFNYRGTLEVKRYFTILVSGDLNGDGRKDLAIRTSDDELTIHLGTAATVWAEESHTLPIPPRGAHPDIEGYTADLDGDAREEIVLLYRQPPGGVDRHWVLRGS